MLCCLVIDIRGYNLGWRSEQWLIAIRAATINVDAMTFLSKVGDNAETHVSHYSHLQNFLTIKDIGEPTPFIFDHSVTFSDKAYQHKLAECSSENAYFFACHSFSRSWLVVSHSFTPRRNGHIFCCRIPFGFISRLKISRFITSNDRVGLPSSANQLAHNFSSTGCSGSLVVFGVGRFAGIVCKNLGGVGLDVRSRRINEGRNVDRKICT